MVATPVLNLLVRPAGFEPAAYGFEGMTSEFPNRLELHQHTENIKLIISIFLLIFHVLADFGKFFSHKFSHSIHG